MKHHYPILGMLAIAAAFTLAACHEPDTADEIDQAKQEQITAEASKTVDLPNITQFTARRTMKMVYEGEDKAIPTYTYHYNTFRGCYVPFAGTAATFGYPVPGATQMTNPSKVYYTSLSMPNADPDGLFKPSEENATYVLMKNPATGNLEPQYSEPDVVTFTFKPQNICQ